MNPVRDVARRAWANLRQRTCCGSMPKLVILQARNSSSRSFGKTTEEHHSQKPSVRPSAHCSSPENSSPANRSAQESKRITKKIKQLPRAQKQAFFEELKKSGRADVYHYSTMLSSCSNSAQAQALMKEMANVGVRPNLVTYNTLIQKHNRDGQVDEAQKVLQEMLSNGVTPDQVTYSSIIDGLSRNSRHRDAMRAWRKLQEEGMELDLYSYNIAVNMYCRANRERNARKVVAQMQAAGIDPTTTTFTPLIVMHGRRARPTKALKVLKEIQNMGLEIDMRVSNAAVSALATNGKVSEAEALVRELTTQAPPSVDHKVRSITHHGEPGAPSAPFEPNIDNGTAAALITGYGRRGELEAVWQTRDRMLRAGVQPDVTVHTAIIHVLCINGMLEEAVEEFVRMEEGGVEATAVTMQALVDGFAVSGDRLGAMQWLWEARRRGLPPFSSYMQRDDARGVIKADLHGMSALSAVVAVEFALSFQPRYLHDRVVVVTGQGKHSTHRKAVVKPAIERFLSSEVLPSPELMLHGVRRMV